MVSMFKCKLTRRPHTPTTLKTHLCDATGRVQVQCDLSPRTFLFTLGAGTYLHSLPKQILLHLVEMVEWCSECQKFFVDEGVPGCKKCWGRSFPTVQQVTDQAKLAALKSIMNSPTPMCNKDGCNKPLTQKTAGPTSKNPGRVFWSCPEHSFVMWAGVHAPAAHIPPAAGTYTTPLSSSSSSAPSDMIRLEMAINGQQQSLQSLDQRIHALEAFVAASLTAKQV